MPRSRFRSIVRATIIAVTAIAGAVMIGTNIYLMTERPVVTRSIPDVTPPGWLCGRVSREMYCVAISDTDRRWADRSVAAFLVVIPFFVVVAARAELARLRRRR